MTHPQRPRHLPTLTSLRWVAATLVFLLHANELVIAQSVAIERGIFDVQPHTWFNRIADQGSAGVSFFFVLSGFVLAWSHQTTTTAPVFYRRRFARIYPAYAVACLVALPVIVAIGEMSSPLHLAQALFPLTLLQAWVPHPRIAYGGNGVSWSLSCEAFFYAVFPFVMPRIAAASIRRTVTVAACLAAIPLVLAGALRPTDPDSATFLFLYANPLTRLVEFVIGIALARLLRDGVRVPWLRLGPTLAVAGAVYLAMGWVPLYLHSIPLTLVPFAAVVFAAAQADLAAAESPGRRPVLHAPWLVRLGQWSFGFYLLHQLVLRLIREAQPTGAAAIAVTVAAYPATAALSAALFRYVEQPLERRLRPAPAVPASAAT